MPKATNTDAAASSKSSPLSSRLSTPEMEGQSSAGRSEEDTCPACCENKQEKRRSGRKEDWVQCEACNGWFHWRCTGAKQDLNTLVKWFCKACIEEDSTRAVSYKAPARKSSRKRNAQDYASIEEGLGSSDSRKWLRILEEKEIHPDPFKRMAGSDVQLSWLEEDDTAMQEPIVIESQEGLGMKMPPADFSVDDVADQLGEHTPVEVIDVATQSTSPGWTLGKWADYVELEPSKRDKIYNVISLEVSGTKIAEEVIPPKMVRDLDWVENFWPMTRKGKGNVYPKVQLYCLMGVESAWTDWHVDFAGSSVYYHILSGAKTFYFIRPTPANLAAYQRWSGSELQYQNWLGDMVDKVYKAELKAGTTMIIPAGWIHAVYTPKDTMVFGGNFLHSYNVETQIKVRNIEIATQVPKKFRFPMFSRLCWYVGDKYLKDLRSHSEFPDRVMEGVLALADFLVAEVRILERGAEQAKKEVKEQIPADRVKDAPALARELRWRARLALRHSSSDEQNVGDEEASNAGKRKRGGSPTAAGLIFKHFKPQQWDDAKEDVQPLESKRMKCYGTKPDSGEGWTKSWIEDSTLIGEHDSEEGNTAVKVRKERFIRVRQINGGVERQKIERTIERWEWDQ